jgi:hypothetical protein
VSSIILAPHDLNSRKLAVFVRLWNNPSADAADGSQETFSNYSPIQYSRASPIIRSIDESDRTKFDLEDIVR